MRNFRALLTAAVFLCGSQTAAIAQSLPAPWSSADVGGPALTGSATSASGTFTVDAGGIDIAGTSDQFHFVYRPLSRDGEIVARIDSLVNTNSAAKAGVMFRDALTGNGRYAMMMITPGIGFRFQRRPATGGSTIWTTGPSGAAPAWVKLVRMGDMFVGYSSTNGTTWQGIGAETIPMGETVYVGLAVTSRNATMVTRATLSNLTVIGQSGNQAPAVTITQPATGTQVAAPATVTINATATDPENRMASVGFYVEGTLISTDTTAPYSASWSASTPGTYSLTARAQDADGGSTTSSAVSVTVTGANQPPTVSLTAPATGSTFTAPATITLTASGSDPEGPLARVEFFNGTTLLGTDTSAPYAFTWSNVAAGSYGLRAVAYDSAGTSASSATATVTVSAANSPPSVSLTSPASGSSYTAPATINLAATAADSNGSVARVDFFSGSTQLGSDTTAPYAFTWSNVAAGSYSLRAVAFDNAGASTSSATATVSVTTPSNGVPTVSLTSPTAGATFTAPATISLAANASDPEGQLARVEFFQGTTQLGVDTTAPYALTWSNVAAGTYSLTARAFDSAGGTATSTPVSVTVTGGGSTTLPTPWASMDVGAPATAGNATYSGSIFTVDAAGTDINGTSDQMHFVYRAVTGNGEIVARVNSLTNTHPFAKAGVMYRDSLTAGGRYAMMMLTGASGYRFQRRPATGGSTIDTTGPAGAAPGWVKVVRSGDTLIGYSSSDGVTWTGLGAESIPMGQTVYVGLAVTSHNASTLTRAAFSSVNVTNPSAGGNQPPTASLTSPAAGATFAAPATINLTANASDPEGQLARVEFFSGTTLLGTDTTAPYAFTWSNVAAGTYSLRAVAYDSAGVSGSSATVSVTVSTGSSTPPTGVVFAASSDHSTNVTNYLLKVFPQGANPDTATPVATSDLAKPTPAGNNDITVDRASFFAGLPPGTYIATVTAIGPGGQTRSASVSFVR